MSGSGIISYKNLTCRDFCFFNFKMLYRYPPKIMFYSRTRPSFNFIPPPSIRTTTRSSGGLYPVIGQKKIKKIQPRKKEWSDLHEQISRKEARVHDRAGKEVPDEHLVEILDLLDRSETYLKSASLRYAVIVGADNRMWLELQGLPGSAKLLNRKPAFTG